MDHPEGEPLNSTNFKTVMMPAYLEEMPSCPAAGSSTYQLSSAKIRPISWSSAKVNITPV